MNRKIKGLIEVLIIVTLFLLFSYLVQKNISYFESLIVNDVLGILVFIFIEFISIVVAPVTTLPLIPIASNLWGWVLTGLISIFAWSFGAWVAFVIGRKYGVQIIKKFISLKDIYRIEKKVPEESLFWTVVLLRLITPVDILSYALGIFTKMDIRTYLFATIIGITPFAFIFAYLGSVPIQYQIISFLAFGVLILIGWVVRIIYKKYFK